MCIFVVLSLQEVMMLDFLRVISYYRVRFVILIRIIQKFYSDVELESMLFVEIIFGRGRLVLKYLMFLIEFFYKINGEDKLKFQVDSKVKGIIFEWNIREVVKFGNKIGGKVVEILKFELENENKVIVVVFKLDVKVDDKFSWKFVIRFSFELESIVVDIIYLDIKGLGLIGNIKVLKNFEKI